MGTKHFCDKCKREIEAGLSQIVKINEGYMAIVSDMSTYNATYELCKSCLSMIVSCLENTILTKPNPKE